ncbi:uncharacterized protein SAPINGB_P005353 [Magnusiomyces paraingens]|uniref:DnaJ homologue subfamily C member 28 conserved domain-containing protein n=1 Tax=Magnusiomyces paraingens TaxID=2606893 RepID=A0A5E8C6R8_9ASCO|nr:uncharacterized protein SAPINGB_P005353 [Saprochaete ingens]VVT56866.1 unnamed protein product [Saprochaete ingens]
MPLRPGTVAKAAINRYRQDLSRKYLSTKPSKANYGDDNDDDDKAMTRRLAQLAEESRPFKDDPLAGKPSFLSPDEVAPGYHETVGALAQKIESQAHKEAEYAAQHQRAVHLARIPKYVSKAGVDTAHATPWTGQEHHTDLAHRMLVDSVGPAKQVPAASRRSMGDPLLPMPTFAADKRAAQTAGSRIAAAREQSLDYSALKHSTEDKLKKSPLDEEDKSGPSFRELYAERFTPVAVAGTASFAGTESAIASLATQRIEAAMARGEFASVRRGPQAGKGTGASTPEVTPHIDTTEYLLNRIVKSQGGAPVWIDRQRELHTRIDNFRREMVAKWVRQCVVALDDRGGSVAEKIARAETLAAKISAEGSKFHDVNWETTQEKYHQMSIDNINSAIRSYNLQAPSVARWSGIVLAKELTTCYATGANRLVPDLKALLIAPPPPPALKPGEIPHSRPTGAAFSMDAPQLLYEEKEEGFLLNRFKDLFRTKLF